MYNKKYICWSKFLISPLAEGSSGKLHIWQACCCDVMQLVSHFFSTWNNVGNVYFNTQCPNTVCNINILRVIMSKSLWMSPCQRILNESTYLTHPCNRARLGLSSKHVYGLANYLVETPTPIRTNIKWCNKFTSASHKQITVSWEHYLP